LFNAGIRPAVNVGLSVSRVGGEAQYKAMKKVSGKLRLDLANYRELAIFSQFVSELDPESKKILKKGEILTQGLKQNQYEPMCFEKQVIFLYVLLNDLLPWVTPENLSSTLKKLHLFIKEKHRDLLLTIAETKELSDGSIQKIKMSSKSFRD
jgi:F-type H+-transporting ATPase subunit alpha